MSETLQVFPLDEDTKKHLTAIRNLLQTNGQWHTGGKNIDRGTLDMEKDENKSTFEALKYSVNALVSNSCGIVPGNNSSFLRAHIGGTGLKGVERSAFALCAEDKQVYIANKRVERRLDPCSFIHIEPNESILISEGVALLLFW